MLLVEIVEKLLACGPAFERHQRRVEFEFIELDDRARVIEYSIVIGPVADTVNTQGRRSEALIEMLLVDTLRYGIMTDHIRTPIPFRIVSEMIARVIEPGFEDLPHLLRDLDRVLLEIVKSIFPS